MEDIYFNNSAQNNVYIHKFIFRRLWSV